MGTAILQQKRGHGGPAYQAPSHRYTTALVYPALAAPLSRAQVTGFADDVSRHPLLAELLFEDGRHVYAVAAEGLAKGQIIEYGDEAAPNPGNVLPLSKIPDGSPVFNIELHPRDGGKLGRTGGSVAYVVAHDEEKNTVTLLLASKETRDFNGRCLATVGVACGGGRTEKPFVKAGNKFYAMHARNRYWPTVRGGAMSAYDHPYGGRSFGKPTAVKRSTPPGRKVGHIAASRTGRRRGKATKEVTKKNG